MSGFLICLKAPYLGYSTLVAFAKAHITTTEEREKREKEREKGMKEWVEGCVVMRRCRSVSLGL